MMTITRKMELFAKAVTIKEKKTTKKNLTQSEVRASNQEFLTDTNFRRTPFK